MSRTLLHDWECSIEENKNNTEELLKIAKDIYNTGYARGKASTEKPQGEWIIAFHDCTGKYYLCSSCKEGRAVITGEDYASLDEFKFCPHCGAKMKGGAK